MLHVAKLPNNLAWFMLREWPGSTSAISMTHHKTCTYNVKRHLKTALGSSALTKTHNPCGSEYGTKKIMVDIVFE